MRYSFPSVGPSVTADSGTSLGPRQFPALFDQQSTNFGGAMAQFSHYTGPPGVNLPQPSASTHSTPAISTNVNPSGPLVATGDWTKDLVHLARTSELKKHALTLQLHTAHILSAHATLDQKAKAIQDVREQRNRYVVLLSLSPHRCLGNGSNGFRSK